MIGKIPKNKVLIQKANDGGKEKESEQTTLKENFSISELEIATDELKNGTPQT